MFTIWSLRLFAAQREYNFHCGVILIVEIPYARHHFSAIVSTPLQLPWTTVTPFSRLAIASLISSSLTIPLHPLIIMRRGIVCECVANRAFLAVMAVRTNGGSMHARSGTVTTDAGFLKREHKAM